MALPKKSLPVEQVLQQLAAFKEDDADWQSGQLFGYVYAAGKPEVALITQAFAMFLHENALDPTVFKSVLKLEQEIIQIAKSLLNAPETAGGNFTSGGTESIFLAVQAARDYSLEEKGIDQPEIILPYTAHPAFFKACRYLKIKPLVVEVDKTSFLVAPEDMEKAIGENTILLVGSSPSYGHGVVDPIEQIGAIALKYDLLFHVDACVGGMYLPFLKKVGYEVPKFDFSVSGVTSMSMDFHKYGYAAKGASIVLHRSRKLHEYQIFTHADWPGYALVNTTMQSARTVGPLAACWAILHKLGEEGYMDLVKKTMTAAETITKGVNGLQGFYILGEPIMNVLAIASDKYDIFDISKKMEQRGWPLQIQLQAGPSPASIHLTIVPFNAPLADKFVEDLKASADECTPMNTESKPQVSKEALEQLGELSEDQLLEQFQNMLGIDLGNGLPEDITPVNKLLNVIPPKWRDKLLRSYVNTLY